MEFEIVLVLVIDPWAKGIEDELTRTSASWHLRPGHILKKLCFDDFRIHPAYTGMEANLLGKPHVEGRSGT